MELTVTSLTVRRGSFTLGPVDARLGPGLWRVTGPNGAGKSTLLRAVAGDIRPGTGSVRLDGRDVHADPPARRAIGWSPVEPELPDFLTVEEAWRMLAALRGRDGEASVGRLAELGLAGSVRLGACSAGMRRKAALVAALAGEPEVLLLDEPFASVDTAAIGVLRGWLADWRASRIVVVVHHGDLGLEVDGEIALGPA